MPGLDLSNAKEVTFEPIPRGIYEAVVDSAEVRQTGVGGNLPEGTDYYNLTWVVSSDDEEVNGRKCWTNHFCITKATLKAGYDPKKAAKMQDQLYTALKNMGFTEDELRTPGFDPQQEDFIGKFARLDIRVVEREYNGQVRAQNNIWVLAPVEATL